MDIGQEAGRGLKVISSEFCFGLFLSYPKSIPRFMAYHLTTLFSLSMTYQGLGFLHAFLPQSDGNFHLCISHMSV